MFVHIAVGGSVVDPKKDIERAMFKNIVYKSATPNLLATIWHPVQNSEEKTSTKRKKSTLTKDSGHCSAHSRWAMDGTWVAEGMDKLVYIDLDGQEDDPIQKNS